ncbi:MAG TPA: TRAP transporter small permease [Candidatus Methylomirabilis sp.]|jgi:TRAP-type C4-dicarboxylate transport system permease small subunit
MIRRLAAVFESLAMVFLAGVLTTVTLQVFFRYVAGIVAPWTEEATRYLGIWMVFMGATAAMAQGSHIAVTVLVERLPEWIQAVIRRLSWTLLLLFSGIVLLGSLQLIRLNWEQQAVTFPVSVAALYLALVVFSGTSLLLLVALLWRGSEAQR